MAYIPCKNSLNASRELDRYVEECQVINRNKKKDNANDTNKLKTFCS